MNLKNKNAIVTGASGGIGSCIAIELAGRGANVAVNYNRHSEDAEKISKDIIAMGRKALVVKADVTKEEQVIEMAQKVYNEFGSIDILINNAGITKDYPLLGMREDEWDSVISVNLTGIFNTCKAVGKYMVLQKNGKIVNLSSIVAKYGGRGQANYIASKGGVESFTRALAIELAPKGITVNAVSPGIVRTKMTEEVIERAADKIFDKLLIKRFGRPQEIAKLTAFLCSEDADYITGQIFNIDGGFGLCV